MKEDFGAMAEYQVHFVLSKDEVVGCLEPAANGLHLALVLKWIAMKTCLPYSAVHCTQSIHVNAPSTLRDAGPAC